VHMVNERFVGVRDETRGARTRHWIGRRRPYDLL
jgi:hypothetical protein